MAKYTVTNGDLLKIKDMVVVNGSNVKIQTKGTGSCQILGRLTPNDEYKVLALVRTSDFDVTDTIKDNEIYATDASCLYSICCESNGFTQVFASITT